VGLTLYEGAKVLHLHGLFNGDKVDRFLGVHLYLNIIIFVAVLEKYIA